MKGFSTLSSVLFALFLAAACGDDDDSTPNTVTCKFPYTDRTDVTLKAATSTTGKCYADVATVCGNDMIQVASNCGVSCNAAGGDTATQLACTQKCIQDNATPKPSDDCTGCYVANVACSIQFCLAQCVGGATPACNACRIDSGCTAAFYTCSGLPVPASIGAGGDGGAGNTSGGMSNTSGGRSNTSGGTSGAGAAGAGAPNGGAGDSNGGAGGGGAPGVTGGSGGAGGAR
ncbi:MAG: hypothetical protein ACOY0T_04950 [Myxococcota bacterium]